MRKLVVYVAGYPAFFLFFFALGAYWTFPYDRLRDRIVQDVERGSELQLEIASLRPSWLTGVTLEGVRVTSVPDEPSRPRRTLAIREAEARISLFGLLTGTTEVSFDVVVEGGGTVEGVYAQSDESLRIDANLQNVDLRRLGPLHDFIGIPIEGRASGRIDMTIGKEAAGTEGSVNLTVRGAAVGDGESPLRIPGMNAGVTLERMDLGTLELRLATERGVTSIERLTADGEHATLRGAGNVRFAHPLRRSSFDDVLVRIAFKDAYRQSSERMGALFSLLDVTPQVRPARTSDGALQWSIRGPVSAPRVVPAGRMPMPGED